MARGEDCVVRRYWTSSLLLGGVGLFLGVVILFLGSVVLFPGGVVLYLGDVNFLEVGR